MRGDDHHSGVGIDPHNLVQERQALTPVRRAALEIEVEQDRVRTLFLQQRQQGPRRTQGFDPPEQVSKREPGGEGNVGVVVDDNSEAERVVHATSVAPLSGNEQSTAVNSPTSNWHGACSVSGDENIG